MGRGNLLGESEGKRKYPPDDCRAGTKVCPFQDGLAARALLALGVGQGEFP